MSALSEYLVDQLDLPIPRAVTLKPQCSKGWGKRCASSTSRRCKCSCGGHNHGNLKARPDYVPNAKRTPDKTLFYKLGERPLRAFRLDVAQRLDVMRAVVCSREDDATGWAEPIVKLEVSTGKHIEFIQELVYHSPDGFEFGYGGSGPSDLALNILNLLVMPKEAVRLHQDFKWQVMGKWFNREGGRLPLNTVKAWIEQHWANEEAADSQEETPDED
jgi:hypothetical protein